MTAIDAAGRAPVVVVGGDPGAHTGLVALELRRPHITAARWLGGTLVNRVAADYAKRRGWSEAERDVEFGERLRAYFRTVVPALVVLEEPADASTSWRGHRHQNKGTAFRLGAYYRALLDAAAAVEPRPRIVSYPIVRFEKRAGWMRKRKRDAVLRDVCATARTIGAPREVWEMKPGESQEPDVPMHNVRMALGVLVHHLSQLPLAATLDPAWVEHVAA